VTKPRIRIAHGFHRFCHSSLIIGILRAKLKQQLNAASHPVPVSETAHALGSSKNQDIWNSGFAVRKVYDARSPLD
jgi:hypothetical protein